MSQNITKSDRIVFWGICGFFLVCALALASGFSKRHILLGRYINPYTLSYFYQLRWNVYTRRVEEPKYQLYTIENNKARLRDLRPFASEYWFGLKRDYKLLAQEVGVITSDTPGLRNMTTYSVTLPKGKDINEYLGVDTLKFNETAHANSILLKGRYLIVKEPTLSWDKARKNPDAPRTVIVLPVNISRK